MRRKAIYQHAGLGTGYAMYYIGWYIIAVTFADGFSLVANGHFKHATIYVSNLRVRVTMHWANATGHKFGLYHHHPVIVPKNLALTAIAHILPFNILLKLEYIALYHC